MLSSIILTLITYFALVAPSPTQHPRSGGGPVNWASVVSSRGDRFPDFSYCGYHNSKISLPSVGTPSVTIPSPKKSSDDMTPAIQDAIDTLALHGGGIVKLPSGRLAITAGIQIRSNVIVTGSGTGSSATTLVLKRRPSKPVFTLGKLGFAEKAEFGFRSKITNSYVPVGSSTVTVKDSSGFAVGQTVYISRATTESWIRYNGMINMQQNGQAQTWLQDKTKPEKVNQKIMSPNTIKAVNGKQITFQMPLTDSLDLKYMKPEVWAYTSPELSSEMGLQNLGIEVPGSSSCSGTPLNQVTCNYAAVRFSSWTVDSWASGLTLVGFNNFFEIQRDASRITIQDSTMNRNQNTDNANSLPFDILIRGSQVLVQDCAQVGLATAECFAIGTDSLTPGPNAITRHTTASSVKQTISPYARWAQGLLVEDTSTRTEFANRGAVGGRGWAINAGVGWNLRGGALFQSPPLGINWCVGCGGSQGPTGNATFIRSGEQVTPRSLFAAQLNARGIDWYDRGD
ncbi:hypothetical protein B0T10DRAFT_464126 [Thelonectria olida]|uniref:Pectate lyase superfamily protein domain-containing protein n=1 Tax=Thelonectria olida TaxID=1576542 RepID=A0A9P8VY93_9HYPO|nr:hypothetical protein B0T10DRAFT_464126 [Thelonectria olida]